MSATTSHCMRGGLVLICLGATLLLAGLACQSSGPTSNLSEYEKLVERRRAAASATPMSVRARQEAEARAADEARAAEEARIAEEQARAERKAAQKRAAEEKRLDEERRVAEAVARKASEEADAAARAAEQAAANEAAAQKAAQEAEEAERQAAEAARRDQEQSQPTQEISPVAIVEPPSPQPEPAPVQEPSAVPAPTVADGRPGTASAYALASGDAVQIYLRGIPQSELVEDILDETGMVSLPLINHGIKAMGLTASQLERTIRDTYVNEGIYQRITVQVIVPTRFYYVQGQVRGPGRFMLQNAVRVSEAIAAAGGGTDFWSGRVFVRRNGTIYKDIRNARKLEKTPEDDILLEPGDIVELREGFF